MRIREKLFILCLSLFLIFMALPVFAALDIGVNPGGLAGQVAGKAGYDVASTNQYSLSQNIGLLIKAALSMLGTIFLALTIYAGILWMTAQGNEEQVTKATGIIKMATIGFIIVLAAYSITTLILIAVQISSGYTSVPVGATTGQAVEQSYGQRFWAAFTAPFQ